MGLGAGRTAAGRAAQALVVLTLLPVSLCQYGYNDDLNYYDDYQLYTAGYHYDMYDESDNGFYYNQYTGMPGPLASSDEGDLL